VPNILLVDDEIHIQRFSRLILEKSGYTVTAVSSREEALNVLGSGRIKSDLVLLDIMMHGIDGIQVLKTINQAKNNIKPVVIILTAIAQEAVVIKGIQLGAKDYIRKPFHPKDLLDRISWQLNPPVATSG
jgi:two-component system alkaline phosphatase synthesis response regulator PhoP